MSEQKSRRKGRRKRQETQSGNPPPLTDRRAMEKSLADLGRLVDERGFGSIEELNAFLQETLASGGIPTTASRTPLEEAQDIMYDAWEAQGRARVRLAKKALSVSPDCADAYVLLAEETARTLEEAKVLYEQGVKAGERALGPAAFEENVGHFWGILETRPYMRARHGLANCLWMLGEQQQAIDHYKDMLRLNPNDNQGIRYILINLLLFIDDDAAAGDLLKQYEDDGMATWLYSRALWRFRREGASKAAMAALRAALEQNRFVPAYLLGRKKLPRQMPPYIGYGDENEAIDYADAALPLWQKDREALAWLRDQAGASGSGLKRTQR